MGCAISKVHTRIIDSSKRVSTVNIQVVDINNIGSYFTDDDNPNPKCIFIFGGSGSNKGQFIWQLLEQRQTCTDSEWGFHYHYIDVEKLIIDNIGKRIKKLTTEKSTNSTNNSINNNEETPHIGHEICLSDFSDLSVKSSSSDDLKTKLLLYANIVTNSWVLSLISREIERHSTERHSSERHSSERHSSGRHSSESREKVFIVNLIPNRINLFRNCLYLRQAPSFVNFHFNYIAINLIKSNSKRKDLDQLASNSGYDEVNSNFINYFRLINKLIEVKSDDNPIKIRIKLTKNSKNSIKISSNEDLLSFIYTPKKDGMEIDIKGFELTETSDVQNGLMFVIKNEIEIEENQYLVFDDNDFKSTNVTKFTKIYFQLKESAKCDRRESQKSLRSLR